MREICCLWSGKVKYLQDEECANRVLYKFKSRYYTGVKTAIEEIRKINSDIRFLERTLIAMQYERAENKDHDLPVNHHVVKQIHWVNPYINIILSEHELSEPDKRDAIDVEELLWKMQKS